MPHLEAGFHPESEVEETGDGKYGTGEQSKAGRGDVHNTPSELLPVGTDRRARSGVFGGPGRPSADLPGPYEQGGSRQQQTAEKHNRAGDSIGLLAEPG